MHFPPIPPNSPQFPPSMRCTTHHTIPPHPLPLPLPHHPRDDHLSPRHLPLITHLSTHSYCLWPLAVMQFVLSSPSIATHSDAVAVLGKEISHKSHQTLGIRFRPSS